MDELVASVENLVALRRDTEPMDRPDPLLTASDLIAERFPDAIQAWLGGSIANGQATVTSDLDITVLLEEVRVHRESLTFRGWPVELFVHDNESVRYFVAKDLGQRKPTMARLVADGRPLMPGDGGAELRSHCQLVLEAGPGVPEAGEVDLARYLLTDLLDDLRGGVPGDTSAAVLAEAWQQTARLLLLVNGHWLGVGKWLARELLDLDEATGTSYTKDLDRAFRVAASGDTSEFIAAMEDALSVAGGQLRAGYRQEADIPGRQQA
jgi:hypothetical protein